MDFLTPREKDTCTYTGVFGLLFSLTCLVQHFTYTNPHWITAVFAVVYLYSIFSFSLLTAQRHPAPFLLIIAACLLLAAAVLLLRNGIFSLVVVLTFIYTAVIAVLTYMFQFSLKFKQQLAARREEKAIWEGKI
jgi:predicted membrane protein